MTDISNISGMNDSEIVEALATKVMGWRILTACSHCNGTKTRALEQRDERDLRPCFWCYGTGDRMSRFAENEHWNPLTNWNNWREVEEKIMENRDLLNEFMEYFVEDDACYATLRNYMKADLRTRCLAALSAISDQSK